MSFSSTFICNLALSHIGGGEISSLTENSTQAKKCNLWYDFCRREALESYDWSFARKRVTLAVHADDAPEGRWTFRYTYPSDCLKARKMQNPFGTKADAIPFEIETSEDGETKTILTDLEDAVLVYTFNQTNTPLYSVYFVEALSHLIASRLAAPITGKHKDIKEFEYQAYIVMLRTAAAHDANEEIDDEPRDADWIRTRSYSPFSDVDTPIIRTLP